MLLSTAEVILFSSEWNEMMIIYSELERNGWSGHGAILTFARRYVCILFRYIPNYKCWMHIKNYETTELWLILVMCPTLPVLTNWHAETILIDGFQNPAETCEGCTPHGMLQIVACPINGAVFPMEAHVRTISMWTVHHTAWQVGHQLQVWRREEVLVWEVCVEKIVFLQ